MKIKNKTIGKDQKCYLIAEISHNHQGEGAKALELVSQAHACGFDAVKFQKRNNSTLFLPDFYNSEYKSENSFGKTYGEHRDFLEPGKDWIIECNKLAHTLGLHFIMTAFDIESLHFCEKNLKIDAYKIQSADLSNLPLIKAVASTNKPYFISCGASSLNEIKEAFQFCKEQKTPFVLMYAISSYPTATENLNLARIPFLKDLLHTPEMGYSCHYLSNDAALIARTLGANVIEKHFTLDKTLKGPDHRISATPSEITDLIGKLKILDESLGSGFINPDKIDPYQLDAKYKMGKCAVAKHDLNENDLLTENDVTYKSPAKGFTSIEIKRFFNKPVRTKIGKGEVFTDSCFKSF
jgi:sialic acid synthase